MCKTSAKKNQRALSKVIKTVAKNSNEQNASQKLKLAEQLLKAKHKKTTTGSILKADFKCNIF